MHKLGNVHRMQSKCKFRTQCVVMKLALVVKCALDNFYFQPDVIEILTLISGNNIY